jgi:hypothetical protein
MARGIAVVSAVRGRPFVPSEADILKSRLFWRLRSGKEPLPTPPPTAYSCPWYELVEEPDRPPWAHEVYVNDDAVYVAQCHYRLAARLSDGRLLVEYGPFLFMAWAGTQRGGEHQPAGGERNNRSHRLVDSMARANPDHGSVTMTDDEKALVARVRELDQAATAGPWQSDGEVNGWLAGEAPGVAVWYDLRPGVHAPVCMCQPFGAGQYGMAGTYRPIADAALIAEYRTLAPRLSDTLDGAYARIAVLEEIIERSARAWTNLNPGIPWEGDLGSAMEAAVADAEQLARFRALAARADTLRQAGGMPDEMTREALDILDALAEEAG